MPSVVLLSFFTNLPNYCDFFAELFRSKRSKRSKRSNMFRCKVAYPEAHRLELNDMNEIILAVILHNSQFCQSEEATLPLSRH